MPTYEWSASSPERMTYHEAQAYCLALREGGHAWRLPEVWELVTLVNYHASSPACDLPDTNNAGYWSNTRCHEDVTFAWGVGFGDGYVGNSTLDTRSYVRAVRP